MALDITIQKNTSVPVMEISGRIVDVDAKKFARKMEIFCSDTSGMIVVDVSRLNFVNSHGLGVLVYHQNVLQRQKRELVILNRNPDPNSYVARLFELTNLNKIMRVVVSWAELGVPAPAKS